MKKKMYNRPVVDTFAFCFSGVLMGSNTPPYSGAPAGTFDPEHLLN